MRRLMSLFLIVLLAGCGEKNGFALAEFKVVRNGAVLLEDKFDGKAAQPADLAPDDAAGYAWLGRQVVPQNKGALLAYDRAIENPANPQSMMHGAMAATNIEPADRKAGLKPGMAFEVSATFDMTVPEKVGQGFFIGLSDGLPASDSRPEVPARDFIQLGYTQIKRATPINIVYFRSTDYTSFASGSMTNQTFALINPNDGEQIKLRIRKTDASTDRVTASYAFVKNGVAGPYTDLEQSIQGAGYMPIFRERAYTRPVFGAFWPKEQDGSDASGKPSSTDRVQVAPIVQIADAGSNAKEELIEFSTRGTGAKALLSYETGKKPLFVAVMIPGGEGAFRFESTPAGVTMLSPLRLQNKLRPLLLQRGIASAMLDAPGDNPEMRIAFRESPEHLDDLKAAVAEIGKRFPGVPLVAVGHSMGAWSATFLSAAMPEKIDATVLIDSVLVDGDVLNPYDRNKGIGQGISAFDWRKLHQPVMLIHHKKDDCLGAPYRLAAELAQRNKRIPLLSIDAEKDASTGFCGASGPHNLDGHEVLVADSIRNWVMQQKLNGKVVTAK